MAEFVIIALTMLFTLLGVIQLALVLNAYTMVRYAAYNAARAGIVHGGDRDKMVEAARQSLLATFPSHGRASSALGMMENYQASVATDQNTVLNNFFGKPITDVEIINNGANCGDVVTFDDPVDTSPIVAPGDARALLSANGIALLVFGILPQYLMGLCTLAVTQSHF